MSQSVNKRPSDRCSRPRYINASICPYINWFVLYLYILWDKLHWGIYLCRTWLTHVKSRATFSIHYGLLIPNWMSFLFLQNGDNVTAKYFFIVVGMINDFLTIDNVNSGMGLFTFINQYILSRLQMDDTAPGPQTTWNKSISKTRN